MKESTDVGMNRTGMALSPRLAKEMKDNAELPLPRGDGGETLHSIRSAYAAEADPIGSMPPPGSLKGMAKTAAKALKGEKSNVFFDKLGARAAFERTGTRLYEALLVKLETLGEQPGGPTRQELEEILEDEQSHFHLVSQAIEELGGDPTLMTPCADIEAVLSMGIVKVATDPRTNMREALEAALQAELADNDGWQMLVSLAEAFDQTELASRFRDALETEERHLAQVRQWAAGMLEEEAFGGRKSGRA